MAAIVFIAGSALALIYVKVCKQRATKRLIPKSALIGGRRAAKSQKLAHSHDPLVVVRGDGCYLIDDTGAVYLDSRNNVASIGHQHPVWVNAVCSQMALTNTNARYLHPLRHQLVEALYKTLPSQLKVCFLVNSGSEANELALRLAKAYTKKNKVLAIDMGYHGFTNATYEASPYKWQNSPSPDHVYSIKFGDSIENFQHYEKISCLITESALSVGGVIFPPKGWLKSMCERVRNYGGVVIFDEVQVGLGRTGKFWAFEHELGAYPDIVTMGKGLGNGFPIGAVLCTQEIADALDSEGREVFSTYGGNPVACAAALGVLRVIQAEGLTESAITIGDFLQKTLRAIETRLIKDIRGRGLFIGIEFQDAVVASFVAKRMYDKHHILTSLDGPNDATMVIKPPLCWKENEATMFCNGMNECLQAYSQN